MALNPDDVKQAVGQTSMEVMDALDVVTARQIKVFFEEAETLSRMFQKRGIEHSHAIQLITSFAAGAAYDASV